MLANGLAQPVRYAAHHSASIAPGILLRPTLPADARTALPDKEVFIANPQFPATVSHPPIEWYDASQMLTTPPPVDMRSKSTGDVERGVRCMNDRESRPLTRSGPLVRQVVCKSGEKVARDLSADETAETGTQLTWTLLTGKDGRGVSSRAPMLCISAERALTAVAARTSNRLRDTSIT